MGLLTTSPPRGKGVTKWQIVQTSVGTQRCENEQPLLAGQHTLLTHQHKTLNLAEELPELLCQLFCNSNRQLRFHSQIPYPNCSPNIPPSACMHAMHAGHFVDSILSLRQSSHPAMSIRIAPYTRRIVWSPRASLINHMMIPARTSSFTLNQHRSAQIRFVQSFIFLFTIDIAQLGRPGLHRLKGQGRVLPQDLGRGTTGQWPPRGGASAPSRYAPAGVTPTN